MGDRLGLLIAVRITEVSFNSEACNREIALYITITEKEAMATIFFPCLITASNHRKRKKFCLSWQSINIHAQFFWSCLLTCGSLDGVGRGKCPPPPIQV